MASKGKMLVVECKTHLKDVMSGMPECKAGGSGAGYRLIEDLADMKLGLQGQDGSITWSLLISMAQDGEVEIVPGH